MLQVMPKLSRQTPMITGNIVTVIVAIYCYLQKLLRRGLGSHSEVLKLVASSRHTKLRMTIDIRLGMTGSSVWTIRSSAKLRMPVNVW